MPFVENAPYIMDILVSFLMMTAQRISEEDPLPLPEVFAKPQDKAAVRHQFKRKGKGSTEAAEQWVNPGRNSKSAFHIIRDGKDSYPEYLS